MKYNSITENAKLITENVDKHYKLLKSTKWSYYFAKSIINPKKDIKKLEFDVATNPKGTQISRQLSSADYITLASKLIQYTEKHKRLPNYLTYGKLKLRPRLYTLMFAKIIVFYNKNQRLPKSVNVNSKAFTKPIETTNEVYNYFCKVFNSKPLTIDDALALVKEHSYAKYFDDLFSNKQSIDRMKNYQGINCTDSCQVFYNIAEQLIQLGRYKKVECIHVQCSSGGHVKLRLTLNDGTKIYRDPACVLSQNGKPISAVWCTNQGTVNPSWFMENLRR